MPRPNLNTFAELMAQCPARPKNRHERRRILEMINPMARRADMGAGHLALGDYYRSRVDLVIRQLRTTRVTKGVVLWKLHSSGIVFKTPKTVFAFDLIDCVSKEPNCNALFGDPGTICRPIEERSQAMMPMTPRQRHELAQLVDYSFYTHAHCDHAGWDLARRIVKAGNKVIVPPSIQQAWSWDKEFAEKLLVPDHTDALHVVPPSHRMGPLRVRVHRGFQVHGKGRVNQCNAYLVTTDSKTNVFCKGDASDTGFTSWLARLHSFGIGVDLYVGNIPYGGSAEEIARWFDCFMVPGHDFDMIHGPLVPDSYWWKVGPWAGVYDLFDWQFIRDRAEHIIWGERYRFTPRSTVPKCGLALATVEDEVVGFRRDGAEGFLGRQRNSRPTDSTQWLWRGRTLELRAPAGGQAPASVFGVFPVDLKQFGKRPILRVGLAKARQQPQEAAESFTLRVSIAEGWGQPPRLLRQRVHSSQDPSYMNVSLAQYARRSVRILLEVVAESAEPPTVWLLNPYIAAQ